jgi:glycosyltransferase involved in cell wall biosynthesis
VRFLGERTDAAEIMAAADIVLHASTSPEPFGLVLIEAMLLGRPVVASALGGPLEIVTPGAGLLFDPTQPEALAAILARLAADPVLRAQLGEAGLRRAGEFTVARTAGAIEVLYDELLGDPNT